MLYTSYTFCTLDLSAKVPEQIELVQNHPTRSAEGKQLQAHSWFDNLKMSQAKYLKNNQSTSNGVVASSGDAAAQNNLAINNMFKGILLIDSRQTGDQK